MKRILMIALLAACAAEAVDTAKIQWVSYSKGMALVEKTKKPAVINFHADWCGYCKLMDRTTYADSAVIAKLKKYFVTIAINPDTEKESIAYDGKTYAVREFMQAVGAMGLPSTLFMDAKKKLITNLPGYVDKATFLPVLSYIHQKCYEKKISFQDYVEKKGVCE